ncbi:DUF1616 domain-containing protein [Halorubellus litoreus]|uniref:DUF1616 domain-containing protein n=1 Tax=Halorubellus litoreus TaxID=755308 RepID=A0ABD5VMZ1_9EURY
MTRTIRWLLDVLAVLVLTVGAALAVHGAVPGVRVAATALLVLFLPGYAVSVALFPRAHDPDADPSVGRSMVERLGASTALSLGLVAFVALAVNFTPYGITRTSILGGVVALTLAFALAGFVRRAMLDPDERYAPTFPVSALMFTNDHSWGADSHTTTYNLAVGLSLVLVVGSAGFAAWHGPSTAQYTEFSVVKGDQTVAEAAVLDDGEPLEVRLENHEGESQEYTAVVVAQRVSEGSDGAVQVRGQRVLATETLSAGDGETASETFQVSPPSGDDIEVAVLLYRGAPPSTPSRETAYRVLTLEVA